MCDLTFPARAMVSADSGHVIDPEPEQGAYDTCRKCGQAIQDDVYGRGLVTMLTGNPECYGRAK